ncbi:MAG: TetR/AcrR family transcriptional regulator, partial [Pseudomonadales bacterium]
MKTRERILVNSLELFNTLGEPHVTTLDICNEMEISPGNLYYHYKGKDEIIAELFARFEEDMQELQGNVFEEEVTVLEVWMYMQLSFEAIARFQFIYRDLTDLMSRYPILQRRFKRLLKAQQATIKNLCAALQLNQALQTSEADLQRIAEHIVMTMSFWLNFEQIQWAEKTPFVANVEECAY